MSNSKIPFVKFEKVPKKHVVNYSVERRSLDWKDFDTVLNVGDWFKINYDRGLVLCKYQEFRIAFLITIIILLTIGFFLGRAL